MKARWIDEYDMHTDSIYKCPGCEKCYAPVFPEVDRYLCVSCGEEVDVTDPEMIKYFEDRAGTKTEMRLCINCGEKTLETHYHRNPVTLEWEAMWGECKKCGMRFIV